MKLVAVAVSAVIWMGGNAVAGYNPDPVPADYDGDGVDDLGILGAYGEWYLAMSSDGFRKSRYGWAGAPVLRGDFDGDGKDDRAIYYQPDGTWFIMASTDGPVTRTFGWSRTVAIPGDYDGDGTTDVAVYDPVTSTWYVDQSTDGFTSFQFGWDEVVPVPADYDGDGKTDRAAYHPNAGMWYILRSSEGFLKEQYGWYESRPVPADYDGDGRADLAVRDPETCTWYIKQSRDGHRVKQYGWPEGVTVCADYDGDGSIDLGVYNKATRQWYLDLPDGVMMRRFGWSTPGDYDGDGKADPVLWHAEEGRWYVQGSLSGKRDFSFGWSDTLPVQGDFDGDGLADPAVYWPETGNWFIQATTDGFSTRQLGWSETIPVPADFDGDGRTDLAVLEEAVGLWSILASSEGFRRQEFGTPPMMPLPADYDGDGRCDIAMYHPELGEWFVDGSRAGQMQQVFGWGAAMPAPDDYDGDGSHDLSVVGNDRTWYTQPSTAPGTTRERTIEKAGNHLVPRDYDGDGRADPARYDAPSGMWYIDYSSNGGKAAFKFGWPDALPVHAWERPPEPPPQDLPENVLYDSATEGWVLQGGAYENSDGSASTVGGDSYVEIPESRVPTDGGNWVLEITWDVAGTGGKGIIQVGRFASSGISVYDWRGPVTRAGDRGQEIQVIEGSAFSSDPMEDYFFYWNGDLPRDKHVYRVEYRDGILKQLVDGQTRQELRVVGGLDLPGSSFKIGWAHRDRQMGHGLEARIDRVLFWKE